MLPAPEFMGLSLEFWAHVRLISERVGYSRRKQPISYDTGSAVSKLWGLGIDTNRLIADGGVTDFGKTVFGYLNFRSGFLSDKIEPNLMDRDEAEERYRVLLRRYDPTCPLPQNLQRGDKKHPLYLTCMVNILTEATLGGMHFDPDPHNLPVALVKGRPVAVMSRRLDGAYPGVIGPEAVWELKEYYDNKTFGSRIADGVYETQLDGLELAALRHEHGIHVQHYLIVDSRACWWEGGGIPYLCRLVDALHMGLVDEIIFGKEALTRWPEIVSSWL